MTSCVEKARPNLTFIVFVLMAFQLLWTWAFVRFVHYESLYRTLPAETYRVELVNPSDYQKLRDPSLAEVQLSNGVTIRDRTPAYYESVLPNYKQVGEHYVLVTTLGTAHYYRRWITDAMPLMLLTAVGLLISGWELHRRGAGRSDCPASAPEDTARSA